MRVRGSHACSGIRDEYPQASASQSGIWLPCSRFRKQRDEMRVHAAPPPGIRQARSRHSPPPSSPHRHRRSAHSSAIARSDVSARIFFQIKHTHASHVCLKTTTHTKLQESEFRGVREAFMSWFSCPEGQEVVDRQAMVYTHSHHPLLQPSNGHRSSV